METLVRWQFDMVWSFLEEHLAGLTEDDVQWAPVPGLWTVRQGDDGRWRPDWIEPEPEDGPPATIGWVTWHIGWWWTEALAAWYGEPLPPREEIYWPGSAAAATTWIRDLATRWRQVLAELPDADLDRMAPFPWQDRPDRTIGHMVLWVNGELMKNAAELGQLKMAHTTARRTSGQGADAGDDERREEPKVGEGDGGCMDADAADEADQGAARRAGPGPAAGPGGSSGPAR